MSDPTQQIDPNPDPELKSALKRLHGNQAAADDLRQRVALLLQTPPSELPPLENDDEAAPAVAGRIGPPRTRWTRLLAIAACLVLVVGGASWYLRELHEQSENAEYVQVNQGELKEMVATHVRPLAPVAPTDRIADVSDTQVVQAELSRRLSRPVPRPDLSGDGWKLTDAATIQYQSQPAARCEFAKAGQRVTLISVPAKTFHDADDNDTYDATIDGHAISGYVAKEGVHCVIGDAGMSLDEITALRKQIQSRSQSM